VCRTALHPEAEGRARSGLSSRMAAIAEVAIAISEARRTRRSGRSRPGCGLPQSGKAAHSFASSSSGLAAPSARLSPVSFVTSRAGRSVSASFRLSAIGGLLDGTLMRRARLMCFGLSLSERAPIQRAFPGIVARSYRSPD
jgi:hypothetical protein